MDNPVEQHLYITGEMMSKKFYPRQNCKHESKNNVVLYHRDSKLKNLSPYGYIGGMGFATVGSRDKPLPAGKFMLLVVNQEAHKGRVADISL